MSEKILVPTLGESITEATVSKWLKREGETVEADEAIVELETDKVNLEVPAPISGTLSEISFKDHQTEITFKDNNFSLEGNGEFLIQKNFDKAYYKIEKKGDEYLFDTRLDFIKNPINFNFLNLE